jgi:excisionase family DNA binding protein
MKEGKAKNTDGFITVDEAAQLVRLSHWTLRSWLHKGRLTRYKSGSRTVVNRSELLGLLETQEGEQARDHMDKFQQLVLSATYAVCVVGNTQGIEFELLDVWTGAQLEIIRARRGFIGVIGLVGGVPRAALAVLLDDVTISALSQAFVQRIEDAISALEQAVVLQTGAAILRRL